MHQQLEDQMQTLLDGWAEAIVSNDPEAIGAFAREDWVLLGARGPGERQQFLDLVASGELTHEQMAFEVLRVWELDGALVVLAHGTNRGHWRGEPFSADEYVTEVFTREGESWRCLVSSLTQREA